MTNFNTIEAAILTELSANPNFYDKLPDDPSNNSEDGDWGDEDDQEMGDLDFEEENDDLPVWDDDEADFDDDEADSDDAEADSDDAEADSDDDEADSDEDDDWATRSVSTQDHLPSVLEDYESTFIKYEDDGWQDRDGNYYRNDEFVEELESAWEDEQY